MPTVRIVYPMVRVRDYPGWPGVEGTPVFEISCAYVRKNENVSYLVAKVYSSDGQLVYSYVVNASRLGVCSGSVNIQSLNDCWGLDCCYDFSFEFNYSATKTVVRALSHTTITVPWNTKKEICAPQDKALVVQQVVGEQGIVGNFKAPCLPGFDGYGSQICARSVVPLVVFPGNCIYAYAENWAGYDMLVDVYEVNVSDIPTTTFTVEFSEIVGGTPVPKDPNASPDWLEFEGDVVGGEVLHSSRVQIIDVIPFDVSI